jgi:hypothetical protein
MRPRFGPTLTVLGHALMTVGLCLLLKPTLADVTAAGAFGTLVGVFAALSKRWITIGVLIPVLAARTVSTITFAAIKHGATDLGTPVLIAPLVTFLPGAALTTATVELAYGEMVDGSSRLVFGGLQMLLLAFGIIAGAKLAGLPRADLAQPTATSSDGGRPGWACSYSGWPPRCTFRPLAGSCWSCSSPGSGNWPEIG